MTTASSSSAWLRRTPTGRYVAFVPRTSHRPIRMLRILTVTFLVLLLLIGR